MEEQSPDVLDLRDYLAVLRRRIWTVIATTVVVVAAAMAVTFTQTPEYRAEVGLIVEPIGSQDDDSFLRQLVLGTQELETQRELVTSTLVGARAANRLGIEDPSEGQVRDLLERTEVSLVRDTQILTIAATSTDPAEAAATAQAFADGYLDYRRQQAVDQLVQAEEALQEREAEVRRQLQELQAELRRPGADTAALRVEQQVLQSELGSLAAQHAALRGSEVFAQGGGQIIRPAQVPDEPFSPRPIRTGALAVVLGLMLGVGFAFLRDFLDDAIRSDDQATRATGRPVVGHIPRWTGEGHGDNRLATVVDPASPVAEAYRSLRTNIRFLSVGEHHRSVLVTSPLAGEGKTTTAANLAVALARTDMRVLLVGTDLRKPTIHRNFGIDQEPGLSDLLAGDVELSDVIRDVGVPNLRVVPGGRVPPNPAELLSSEAMTAVMSDLEEISDFVVYDGPPVMPVADALELGPRTQLRLLVIDTGVTGRHVLRAASQRLAAVDAEVTGIVLNRVDASESYYGGEYYGQYETTPEPAPEDGMSRRQRRKARRREARLK